MFEPLPSLLKFGYSDIQSFNCTKYQYLTEFQSIKNWEIPLEGGLVGGSMLDYTKQRNCSGTSKKTFSSNHMSILQQNQILIVSANWLSRACPGQYVPLKKKQLGAHYTSKKIDALYLGL